jgi:hypothetical protein
MTVKHKLQALDTQGNVKKLTITYVITPPFIWIVPKIATAPATDTTTM